MGQRAQLALLIVWATAGLLVLVARAITPSAESVLTYLSHTDSTDAAARELPLRLSRLSFTERRQVFESEAFARLLRRFSREEFHLFLEGALPDGVRALLVDARNIPDATRLAWFNAGLDEVQKQAQPDDPRLDRPFVRQLVKRGVAMYEDEAGAEDRLIMAPLLRRLSFGLGWL